MVHDFVTFFERKVEDIRTATSTATSPDIQLRRTNRLCHISLVSCLKSSKSLRVYHQNPLALIRCLCGWSRRCKTFWFLVTLNPDHLTSYRPISNLSFIFKVVECILHPGSFGMPTKSPPLQPTWCMTLSHFSGVK